MKLDLNKRPTQVLLGVLVIAALAINVYFWDTRRVYWPSSSAPTVPSVQPSRPQIVSSVPATPTEPTSTRVIDSVAADREATEAAARRQAEAVRAAEAQRQVELARAAEAQRQAEVTRAAEARRQYLARYLNVGVERKSGMNLVAVIAATEAGKIDRELSQAIATRLKTSDVEITGTFFKPELVADGLLEQLFAESTQIREQLGLTKTLDGLILARLAVEYVSTPALQDLITAKMSVEITAQAVAAGGGSKSWKLATSGAGFDQNTARAMVEERILKAISADTQMSLVSVINAK